MIQVIKNANLPHLRFEFHPETKKVYVMELPTHEGQRIVADVIAEHCDSHAAAFGAVQTWSRGYRAGQKHPATLEIKT